MRSRCLPLQIEGVILYISYFYTFLGVADYLFKLLTLVINNEMVRTDGLISILRGFKRQELNQYANHLKAKSTIHWRWAFRYQWKITKQ